MARITVETPDVYLEVLRRAAARRGVRVEELVLECIRRIVLRELAEGAGDDPAVEGGDIYKGVPSG